MTSRCGKKTFEHPAAIGLSNPRTSISDHHDGHIGFAPQLNHDTPIGPVILYSVVQQVLQRLLQQRHGDGASISPPLEWIGAPAGKKSFAVIMHHLDLEGKTAGTALSAAVAMSVQPAAGDFRWKKKTPSTPANANDC